MTGAIAFFLALGAIKQAPKSPSTPPATTVQAPAQPPVPLPVELEAQRRPSLRTGGNVLIKNGRILTVTQGELDGGDLLIQGGKIVSIGKNLTAPANTTVIDATGRTVTPGLVDAHSHRGLDEINEWTDSITAEVRIKDVLNPSAEGLYYNLANGITTCLALHGSSNAIGGQSIVIKSRWMAPVEDLPFQGLRE